MNEIQKPQHGAGLGRRAFLRFGVSGLTVPLGAMVPASWHISQSSPLAPLFRPPSGHLQANVTAAGRG